MIIGWMFAVIFIVAFFIGRSDYSELAAENAKQTEELTAAETDRRNLDEDVQALKDVLGVPLDQVGVGDERQREHGDWQGPSRYESLRREPEAGHGDCYDYQASRRAQQSRSGTGQVENGIRSSRMPRC